MPTPERLSGTVTFLFTDIEGSTRLLKSLGRESYRAVLGEHQQLLGRAFATRGGKVVDTQGDSFLAVFESAANAVAAAIEAQRALASHEWPDEVELRVRMGIHTAEASFAGERYVGLGLHRAARIGAAAHGGQVLLSGATRELVEDDLPSGLTVRGLGSHRLKDIEQPVPLYQLVGEGLEREFPRLRTVKRARPHRTRVLLAGALAGVVAAAVAIPIFAFGQGGSGKSVSRVRPNSLAIIDASSNRIVSDLTPGGTTPSEIAFGEGSLWVANRDSQTVSRIDPYSHQVVATFSAGGTPTGLTVGGGAVWIANGFSATVVRVDPRTNGIVQTISVGGHPSGIAVTAGAVWVADSINNMVIQIDPETAEIVRIPVGRAPSALVSGADSVWVANSLDRSVSRIDARSGLVTRRRIALRFAPTSLAFGDGALWAAGLSADAVSRIDPRTDVASTTISVGDAPTGLTAGRGAVWVADSLGDSVMKITSATGISSRPIRLGQSPDKVILFNESLWVTVHPG